MLNQLSSSFIAPPLSWRNKLEHDMHQIIDVSDSRNQVINTKYINGEFIPEEDAIMDLHCNVGSLEYNIDFVMNFDNQEILIMIDDVFWHGLTRNVDELSKSIDEVDQLIFEVMKRDFIFNKYCEDNKKNLIRFVAQDYFGWMSGCGDDIMPFYSCGSKKIINKYVKFLNASRNQKAVFTQL